MLEFFKRAFHKDSRWKEHAIGEAPEVPQVPSIVLKQNKDGKWVYEQPNSADYDPETHTLTLRQRRRLNREFESFIAIRNPELLVCPVDFDTMSAELLEQSMREAREYAVRIPKEGYVYVSDILRLTFYVYFKQATEGDITEQEIRRQPSMFRDWEGYWKVCGWKMVRGLPREEARDRYVKMLSEAVSTRGGMAWTPRGFDECFLKGEAEPEALRQAREKEEAEGTPEELAAAQQEREAKKWIAFFEGVRIVRNLPRRPYQMPEPMRAMFYALYKQATVGDLSAFQKSEECQRNPHYAWLRQRPEDPPASGKAKEKKEKREKRDREQRHPHRGHGAALPLSDPRSTVYDFERGCDDPRTMQQLQYDFWKEQEGVEHFDAVKKYLKYFYRTAARHGYVWDPPGCEDHVPDVVRKDWVRENAADADAAPAGKGPSELSIGVEAGMPTQREKTPVAEGVANEMLALDSTDAHLSEEELRRLREALENVALLEAEVKRKHAAGKEATAQCNEGERDACPTKAEEAEEEAAVASRSTAGKGARRAARGGHVDPREASEASSPSPSPSPDTLCSSSSTAEGSKMSDKANVHHGGKPTRSSSGTVADGGRKNVAKKAG